MDFKIFFQLHPLNVGIALFNPVFQNGRQYGCYIQNGDLPNVQIDGFKNFFFQLHPLNVGTALVNSVFQNDRQYGHYIQNGYSANTKVDEFQNFFFELYLL